MTALRAGFAQRDITPPLGLPLGGYGARAGGADGVLDPLYCRAAYFDDESEPVAVMVFDLVHVFGSWTAQVRQRVEQRLGIAGPHCLIAATHTHAGPGVFRSAIATAPEVQKYETELIEQTVSCLAQAKRAAVPAGIRFGTAPTRGVAANRRDPSLSVDETVRVLAAHTPAGELAGVVANFACHPTVLPAANHAYSGDLFGAAATQAAKLLHAPVMLTNGAAGDVSTRFTRREQTHAEVQRLGGRLAEAIAAAVRGALPLPAAVPLGAVTRSVPVRRRELASPQFAAAQLQAALDDLAAVQQRSADAAAVRLAQSRVEGAQAELWLSNRGGWEALFGCRPPRAELQALHCGDLTIVAAPGELFSGAGRWLHQQLGERTLVVGYANDYLGYFVPHAEAAAGGYEALIAMVDPRCEESIRCGLIDTAGRANERLG
ncbi:MAG: neutral/alkaline non-lysosomal ceramidase N-terminal domain-containing protein [Deltaproteobacteria bacterium]|nr:neutral/alkaline non-lysosomal ceramidase N-terminal domain-containing protein [Deltaproteobacteria bacterium]